MIILREDILTIVDQIKIYLDSGVSVKLFTSLKNSTKDTSPITSIELKERSLFINNEIVIDTKDIALLKIMFD